MGNVKNDSTQYPWKWEPFPYPIHDQKFSLIQILNPDDLLDQLIDKGPDNPDYQDDRIPYWADLWPSAIGMAEYILMNPGGWKSKNILEIGCGMGLPGMVATKLGAKTCITDYLPEAFEAARLLWEMNGLQAPTCETMDWRSPLPHLQADIVLASDVVYEERNFQPLIQALPSLMSPAGYTLLSEPKRSYSKDFFTYLTPTFHCEKVHTAHFTWKGSEHSVDVYRINKK